VAQNPPWRKYTMSAPSTSGTSPYRPPSLAFCWPIAEMTLASGADDTLDIDGQTFEVTDVTHRTLRI